MNITDGRITTVNLRQKSGEYKYCRLKILLKQVTQRGSGHWTVNDTNPQSSKIMIPCLLSTSFGDFH